MIYVDKESVKVDSYLASAIPRAQGSKAMNGADMAKTDRKLASGSAKTDRKPASGSALVHLESILT